MDFLLKNGKIYDGTGADAFLGDILVRGNRIEKIGEELICDGAQVIDLQGLSVSSGFMDAHSHNDWFAIRKDPRPFFEPFIRQGITSFITGNCGLSATGFAPDTPYLDKIGGGLFGYRGEEVFKDCASLSGGELARLRFAELALERPNLMFLDEPTNHLDIYMRESLTQALAAYTGTLLLVTHDRYLMQTLGCPIMYLEDGKATFYPSFAALQNRDAGKTQEQQKTEDTAKKQAYGKEQRKRRAEVRARLKKVETEIEELGAHIVELENEINDPEVLRDHLLLRDKCDELDDTRFHQQELYDEWEKLAEEQETFENEGE